MSDVDYAEAVQEASHPSDYEPDIERLPAKVVREGGTVMTFEEPREAFKTVETDDGETVTTLIVPTGTRVVYPIKESGSWNNEHLRVEEAIVDSIDGDTTVAHSVIDEEFLYIEGEWVRPRQFEDDPSKVSAPGIHVFATRKGAEHWGDGE